MVQGIIENLKELRHGENAGTAFAGFVREAKTWRRCFVHPSGCVSGAIPRLHARVAFEIDLSDPRGPRAIYVRVIAEPGPTIEQTCARCANAFDIDPCAQVWYLEYKLLSLPTRCPECRAARRHDRPMADVLRSGPPAQFDDVRVRFRDG